MSTIAALRQRRCLLTKKLFSDGVYKLSQEQEAQAALLEQTRLNAARLKIAEENVRLAQEEVESQKKRLAAEEAARAQEQKARELAAKSIPPLSPIQQPAQQPEPTKPPAVSTPQAAPPPQTIVQQTANGMPTANPANAFAKKGAVNTISTVAPTSTVPGSVAATTSPISAPDANPKRQRAIQIHKSLKALRNSIHVQTGQNPALKNRAGDLRRELRKCVGQLSFDKKGNNIVVSVFLAPMYIISRLTYEQSQKVSNVLKEGLANQVGSHMMDPSPLIFDQRQPVDSATNNAEMPSLFLFLVNHLAKCVIKQFINECSANTKTADPIGVLVASTFSDPTFQWRGKPLIDILMAKFYVVCPVLFGARGVEKTEQGREKVGWMRRGPNAWIPEAEHYDRQQGLGSGYAAISLRDFSRSKKKNPYPMRHYWESFALIVNTQPTEMSNTQCVVLKAMIDHYEQRFLQFYGTAAMAALRLALVDFPTNAKSAGCGDSAVQSLLVHGKTLKARYGLVLV